MAAISVSGLSTQDSRVTVFAVELYTDSALSSLVSVGTAPGVYDPTAGTVNMLGGIVFDGLTLGTTYYLRSCTVIPTMGRGDWSATYSLAAGPDTIADEYEGVWSSTVAYTVGQIVTYSGVAYLCLNNVAAGGNNPSADTTDWLALAGSSGSGGSITFGTGAPSGTAAEGALYFDTTSSTYAMYVYHTSAWHAAGGGSGTTGGVFSSGSNSNGYWVQDPTGHIHQWGAVSTDIDSGSVSVSFPTAFSSATGVSVVVSTQSSNDRITYVDGSATATGFVVSNNGSGGYAYWHADGPGTATGATTLTNPMTTTGDVIIGGTSGTPERLGVGTDGYVLTARSSAAYGVNWEALSGESGSTPFFTLTAPVLTDFTWINQGSATATQNGSTVVLNCPQSSGDQYRCLVKSIPSEPVTITTWFYFVLGKLGNNQAGMVLVESSSGKMLSITYNQGATAIQINKLNGISSWNSNYTATNWPDTSSLGMRIRQISGTRYFDISVDGLNWWNIYSTSDTDWITPDQVGVYVNANDGAPNLVTLASYSES